MDSPFKWNPNKHDDNLPPEVNKSLVKCTCGGTLFIRVCGMEVINDGTTVRTQYPEIAPMCIKCNNMVDVKKFLKELLEKK